MTRRTVHLIDASPYVFRALYSLPESLVDTVGRPVGAVLGFTNFLIRYLAEEQPTHVGLAFDECLTTSFRNEVYPDYKSNREEAPEGLDEQFELCQAMAAAMGLATYVDGRYEADDLIATLCRQLVRRGHHVIVVSCDKDLTQLVDPRVCFFDYARERRMDERDVYGRFGVWPRQIPDFLGLAGDAVDSIPGVRGVGPKTAVALLDAFGDIDTLYASLDEVSALPVRGASTLGAKLSAQRDMAFLSRDLATVAIDAPVKASLRELAVAGADADRLDPLLEELGFANVRRRIPIWRRSR